VRCSGNTCSLSCMGIGSCNQSVCCSAATCHYTPIGVRNRCN
jgi:hypothetical protein